MADEKVPAWKRWLAPNNPVLTYRRHLRLHHGYPLTVDEPRAKQVHTDRYPNCDWEPPPADSEKTQGGKKGNP